MLLMGYGMARLLLWCEGFLFQPFISPCVYPVLECKAPHCTMREMTSNEKSYFIIVAFLCLWVLILNYIFIRVYRCIPCHEYDDCEAPGVPS